MAIKHPELREGEQFLINATPKEFKAMEKTAPKALKPLRMGRTAYKSNSRTIVPKYRPIFGRAKQPK